MAEATVMTAVLAPNLADCCTGLRIDLLPATR